MSVSGQIKQTCKHMWHWVRKIFQHCSDNYSDITSNLSPRPSASLWRQCGTSQSGQLWKMSCSASVSCRKTVNLVCDKGIFYILGQYFTSTSYPLHSVVNCTSIPSGKRVEKKRTTETKREKPTKMKDITHILQNVLFNLCGWAGERKCKAPTFYYKPTCHSVGCPVIKHEGGRKKPCYVGEGGCEGNFLSPVLNVPVTISTPHDVNWFGNVRG